MFLGEFNFKMFYFLLRFSVFVCRLNIYKREYKKLFFLSLWDCRKGRRDGYKGNRWIVTYFDFFFLILEFRIGSYDRYCRLDYLVFIVIIF